MNRQAPFVDADLAELDSRLLDRAVAVVPMGNVAAGQTWPQVIGMRHDVDNVIEPAVEFARWEQERGYRSTYYILHTSPYWRNKRLLRQSLEFIVECGHDLGIHNNALAAALATGFDPREILFDAVTELRGYGFDIRSTVAHGDQLCYDDHGNLRFVNDELFVECARPNVGAAQRRIGTLNLAPVPMSDFGLEFDANWLGQRTYLSDSGGQWSGDGFDAAADAFPFDKQLHVLIHADWWGRAFVSEEIAA